MERARPQGYGRQDLAIWHAVESWNIWEENVNLTKDVVEYICYAGREYGSFKVDYVLCPLRIT